MWLSLYIVTISYFPQQASYYAPLWLSLYIVTISYFPQQASYYEFHLLDYLQK